MAVLFAVLFLVLQGVWLPALAQTPPPANPKAVEQRKLSPEETMARRFPQPVRVGDLIGLPVLDDQDSTIGYIHEVVRTPTGKIQLVVPYGHFDKAPTYEAARNTTLGPDEMIKIALGRR